MKKAIVGTNGRPSAYSLFPQKVKLIRTGEICENQGYYGDLFTLKLPDGRLAEVHRRELDVDTRIHARVAATAHSKSKSH